MAKVIQDITLEVIKPNLFQAIVAKQYDDNSRFLRVTLVNNGEKLEIKKTSTAIINANRVDGECKSFMGEANDDGTATLPLNYWMLTLEGMLYCDVSIIDADSRKLTSTSFTVSVEKSASGKISDNPDSDEYTLLFEATTAAKEAAALANAAAQNVMNKDQVASVLDVVKKTPLYIGSGTNEQINTLENLGPGTTIYFDESDTSWEDLLAEVAGKAPGGYGYGGEAVTISSAQLTSEEELDDVLNTIYETMQNRETKLVRFYGYPSASDFVFFGFLFRSSTNYGTFIAHSAYCRGSLITKTKSGGAWEPLEWENPPMLENVEYRTTKRFKGSPVYMKVINCGELPSNGGKTVAHNIASCKPISCVGIAGGGLTIPYTTATGYRIEISAHETGIVIYANYETSTRELVAILEYVK